MGLLGLVSFCPAHLPRLCALDDGRAKKPVWGSVFSSGKWGVMRLQEDHPCKVRLSEPCGDSALTETQLFIINNI